MERISGIGGICFRARDPAKLAAWYRDHLGMPIGDDHSYGTIASEGPGELTVWSVFAADTEYFGPGTLPLMVDYRVQDLDATLTQLRAAGAEMEDPQR
jgi:catechol 2,3-dioxygenase-like lactoylglutathione lyase family enzyme